MSLHITHRGGALVVTALSATRDDCLTQLSTTLGNFLTSADRVVLDLSEVTLAPAEPVRAFMEHLTNLHDTTDCDVVVVADRLSARRVLRTASRGHCVPVVPSLATALDQRPRVGRSERVTGLPAL
jgi:hypothetical protein